MWERLMKGADVPFLWKEQEVVAIFYPEVPTDKEWQSKQRDRGAAKVFHIFDKDDLREKAADFERGQDSLAGPEGYYDGKSDWKPHPPARKKAFCTVSGVCNSCGIVLPTPKS